MKFLHSQGLCRKVGIWTVKIKLTLMRLLLSMIAFARTTSMDLSMNVQIILRRIASEMEQGTSVKYQARAENINRGTMRRRIKPILTTRLQNMFLRLLTLKTGTFCTEILPTALS
jgi:hypothetical protein